MRLIYIFSIASLLFILLSSFEVKYISKELPQNANTIKNKGFVVIYKKAAKRYYKRKGLIVNPDHMAAFDFASNNNIKGLKSVQLHLINKYKQISGFDNHHLKKALKTKNLSYPYHGLIR